MSDPVLAVTNLGIAYGPEVVFSGLNLSLHRGETLSIVGPSGCGKTSLLSAVAGLLPVTEGVINLGVPQSRVGLMFQRDRLLPWKRITENVLLGLSKADYREAAEKWMLRTGIAGQGRKFPGQLSGGQRQRAALSRTLCRAPELLLLDEPFASLDEQTREDLQDMLLSLHRELQFTLITVTHNIEEAVLLGERIMVMGEDGGCTELKNPRFGTEQFRETQHFYSMAALLRKTLKGGERIDKNQRKDGKGE